MTYAEMHVRAAPVNLGKFTCVFITFSFRLFRYEACWTRLCVQAEEMETASSNNKNSQVLFLTLCVITAASSKMKFINDAVHVFVCSSV